MWLSKLRVLSVMLACSSMVNGGFAKIVPEIATSPADRWAYADIADVFGPAPLVIRAKITQMTATGTPASGTGATRFYVEGDVVALIRGSGGVAPRVGWLVDAARDSRGRTPKLKGTVVLLAARTVPGRPGSIQLLTNDSQQAWSAALDSRVRAVLAALTAPDAVPAITGISSAFHSAGTIIGESETQIFLSTASGVPVSLSVLNRPGTERQWSFSQGEVVDDNAAQPARDTVAWYRLACFLPPTLPDRATGELAADDAQAAQDDYRFVKSALSSCPRARSGQI